MTPVADASPPSHPARRPSRRRVRPLEGRSGPAPMAALPATAAPPRRSSSSSSPSSPPSSSSSSLSLFPRIVSGSIGAIVTALAVTPLEVVKVRQQAAAAALNGNNNGAANRHRVVRCPLGCGTFVLNNGLMDCVLPKSAVPYFDAATGRPARVESMEANNVAARRAAAADVGSVGPWTLLLRIFRHEGLRGIYAGLSPTLVMSVPNTVLYFTAYDEIAAALRSSSLLAERTTRGESCNLISSANSSISPEVRDAAVPLLGGSMARTVATATTAPLELLRTRQAARTGGAEGLVGESRAGSSGNGGIASELRLIIKEGGGSLGSLYRGLAPTLWRDVPFSAVYWLCLEKFKAGLASGDGPLGDAGHGKASAPPLIEAGRAFVSGAAAGMIAAAVTAPFDVVKTRRQMEMQAQAGVEAPASVEVPRLVTVGATDAATGTIPCDHGGADVYRPPPRNNSLVTTAESHVVTNGRSTAGTTTAHHLVHIWRTEGLPGLWRGNGARMLKVAPACAIMISCYEFGKRVLGGGGGDSV